MKSSNNVQPYFPSKKTVLFAYGIVLSVIVIIALFLNSIIKPSFASKFNLSSLFETEEKTSAVKVFPIPSKIDSKSQAQKDVQVNITITPSATPRPTSKVNPTIKSTPVSNCIRYKITNGDFTSDKCYTQKDYSNLVSYLSEYNMAVFEYNSANSTVKFTCTGSDFFKDSCEDAKDRRDDAEEDIDKYKSKIKEIIARGK